MSGYARRVRTPLSRRRFLAVTAGATLLTACSQYQLGTVAEDGSVTVGHAFGETRIPAPPTRVVSAGLTGQDALLAVGVVPVAVTDWFGGQPFAVWPWAQPKLGDAQPVVLSLAEGIQVDQIAELDPDLIVATNAGLDEDTFAELSEIAPTIAQPGPQAFYGPWDEQATLIGQAVFKANEMATLIADAKDKFAAVAVDHPEFTGKRALLLQGRLDGDTVHTVGPAWRTEFLNTMGLVVPEDIDTDIAPDDRQAVFDSVDVLIWTTESDGEQAALLADPIIEQQRNVFTGKEIAGAIAFASPLSYPVVADRLPPMLAQALA